VTILALDTKLFAAYNHCDLVPGRQHSQKLGRTIAKCEREIWGELLRW
jgi:hypothetical protein